MWLLLALMHALLPEKQQQHSTRVIALIQYILQLCLQNLFMGQIQGKARHANLRNMYDFLYQCCVEVLFMNEFDCYVVLIIIHLLWCLLRGRNMWVTLF